MSKTKQTSPVVKRDLRIRLGSLKSAPHKVAKSAAKLKKGATYVHAQSIGRVHEGLSNKLVWYRRWHEWNYHKYVHYAIVTVYAVSVGIILTVHYAHASGSSWIQSDWSGGVGSSTTNQYSAATNATTSTANQVKLTPTSNWYNLSWKYRKKITFNNTTANLGTTSAALVNYPVLIKLTSSNFNFSLAQSAGQDIRFTDSDGTTALNYEIESWSNSGQTANIWVNVPQIDSNSSTDGIYMYYGNSSASDGQSVGSVWNSNYLSVYHLNNPASPIDSTSNANNGTNQGVSSTAGQIGGAGFMNGTASNSAIDVSIGDTTALRLQGGTATFSFWINPIRTSWPSNYTSILAKRDANGANNNYEVYLEQNTGHLGFYNGSLFTTSYIPSTGVWTNIVVTVGSNVCTFYANGALITSLSSCTIGSASTASTFLGYYNGGGSDQQQYDGSLDEVRISNTALSAAWIAADYKAGTGNYTTFASQEITYPTSSTLTSNIYDTGVLSDFGNLTYAATVPTNTTVSVLVRAGNQANLSDAPAFTSCGAISSGAAITSSCAPHKSRYVQYQLQFTSDGSVTPTFTSITIPYTPSDITTPPTNASAIAMYRSNGGTSVASNGWDTGNPYFSWTAGADESGGSGISGYCLYLGQDSTGNPITTKGDLGTSPIGTGGACQFEVSSTNLDTSVSGYIGTALTSSTNPYYLNIKAIDNAGNVYNGSSAQFQFKYDNVPPANPSFISAPSEFVSNKQVTLTWSTSGADAASDDNSGVAGLQYRIGSTGTWYGANHNGNQNATDLLTNNGTYTTLSSPDFANLVEGNNIIYFRTWDNAGNTSTANVTTVVKINTTAPSTPQNLTATPTTNTTNSFAFSWLAPATFTGSVSNITYCYTVNVLPSSSNCTYTAAGQTSLDAGAYATEPGDNTFYVVAKDEAGNINYATEANTTFTANTPAPGIPLNLDIADISVKTTSNWKLALSWESPTDVGSGVSTYKVFRSTNGTSYTDVASTAGTSYVDSGLSQQTYYYKIQACDSANNCGGFTSVVNLLPTGKFTSSANLISGPDVATTTRTATITWTTDRASDSSVEYGLSSGNYFTTAAANTNQVTSHNVELNSLTAGTTYYYRSQWTDIDGNVGTSAEQVFTTLPAPAVSNVNVGNINLTTSTIQFTSSNATAVQLEYGGGVLSSTQKLNTSTDTSTYSIPLSGLSSGTTYTFKLNPYDTNGDIYDNPTAFTFTTPPEPVITNVQFQPVTGALTGSEQISWTTNVPATSQISYGLVGGAAQNQLDTAMKTDHTMTISDLTYNTQYSVTATSVDNLGNVAHSDQQVFKSGTDTRPPKVSNLTVQPSIVGNGAGAKGQLVVSWKTDKAGTSQVAYGEGTGGGYSTKTAENAGLVNNHVVIVSGLSTSQVYHLQVISNDSEGIKGVSSDQTTIIGQASDNALSIVFNALQSIFGL